MHILLATDADWLVEEVTGALGADDVSFTVCREGRVVADQVLARQPDLGIFDLQIGSMGGMAVTMSLRLDESAGLVPHVPVLMLLDRRADVHLARRSGAEGWLVKPIDSLRLRRAVRALLAGERYTEGPVTPLAATPGAPGSAPVTEDGDGAGDADGTDGTTGTGTAGGETDEIATGSAEEEAATAG